MSKISLIMAFTLGMMSGVLAADAVRATDGSQQVATAMPGGGLQHAKRKKSCCTMLRLIPRPSPGKAPADGDLAFHIKRTFEYLESHDYMNAFIEGRQSVAEEPQSAVAHYLVGAALMCLADFPEATNAFLESIKLDSSSADTQFMLAQSYRLRGQYDDAVAAYKESMKLKPSAQAQALLAECYRMQGADWRMTMELSDAVKLDPQLPLPHTILADAHLMQGRTGLCQADFQRALKLAPEDPYVRFRYGQALELMGKLPEAELELRKATELDPAYSDAMLVLAVVLGKQKKMSQAIAVGEKAVALATNDVDTHVILAGLHAEAGNFESAVKEYKLASKLRPKSLRIQRELAMAMARTHRLDEAIVELSMLTRQLPQDEDLKLMLGALVQQKRAGRDGGASLAP